MDRLRLTTEEQRIWDELATGMVIFNSQLPGGYFDNDISSNGKTKRLQGITAAFRMADEFILHRREHQRP